MHKSMSLKYEPSYTTQRSSTLHPTPHTLHPTLHTLHRTPYTLHPTPYTPHPTPHTLHPTLYTLHPEPCACTGATLNLSQAEDVNGEAEYAVSMDGTSAVHTFKVLLYYSQA